MMAMLRVGDLVGRAVAGTVTHIPRKLVRRVATAAGFSEAVTFGFIEAKAVEAFGTPSSASFAFDQVMAIANPLTAKFDTLRPSLLPGLDDVVAHNRRHGRRDVRLFEIGTRFSPAGETRGAAAAWTGASHPIHWSTPTRDVDFFDAKGLAETIADAIGVPLQFEPLQAAFLVDGQAASIVVAQASCLWGNRAARLVDHFSGRQDVRRPHSQDRRATALAGGGARR